MISQKQMKEWIPEAVTFFKTHMPPIDIPYPEIYILSPKTWEQKRSEIVKAIQSPQANVGEPAKMETLRGSQGDAILIYQRYIRENPYNRNSEKELFQHTLWHELGHFYSSHTECPDESFYQYMDQRPRKGEEAQKQIAYWLWTEFIAEVIACKLDHELSINWDTYNWHSIRNDLVYLIRDVTEKDEDFIDEYALGHYMARILADKKALAFIHAAKAGEIKVPRYLSYGLNQRSSMSEKDIDPTARLEIKQDYHGALDELEELLSSQLKNDPFWRIDTDFLLSLSQVIQEMRSIKLMQKSSDDFDTFMRRVLSQQED